MKEIILDTETTGLSVSEDHRIVEIACIETEDLVPTNKVFYKLINPERSVSEAAFQIHGYSLEVLKKEKKFLEIADELLDFISGKKLIIHNAPFDIGFLNHEFKKINKKIINIDKNVIDSLELARSKYPGTSNSLDNLCKRFNIDISRRKKHNALLDCELLREVYINLVGGKEPTLTFQEPKNPVEELRNFDKKYSKIVIKPTLSEIESHKIFLKKDFKKNYFWLFLAS